ncbi:hypothetical protein SAMN02910453_0472 [Lachnospiraceae bacterium A10]|nr:hypothetical protein SAMN02910453_0472 [Lachnospiraceae bacterium A10]
MNQVEKQLFNIISNHKMKEYPGIIEQAEDDSLLYNLSPIRGNIVRILDSFCVSDNKKILEWDAGYGAVTGALLDLGCYVTSVVSDDDQRLILKTRIEKDSYEQWNHLEIMLYADMDSLEERFDYIVISDLMVESTDKIEQMLAFFKKHLNVGGKIIIGADNKYGLKYFAGCKDRFTNDYFSALEGYVEHDGYRMFSLNELERSVKHVGLKVVQLLFPYPDHRYTFELFSEQRMPVKGELNINLRNFWEDRVLCFDETRAFDTIIADDKFRDFSNSYLFVIEAE